MNTKNIQACVLDTETTGVKDPQPIEVAYMRLDGFMNPVEPIFCERYKPAKPIELGAMATHHITDDDVNDCPPYTDFVLPGDIAYMIGHNIDFDQTAINACGKQPEVKLICTLALCRKFWPNTSHTLSAMLYKLDMPYAIEHCHKAHSAGDDIRMTYRLLELIIKEINALVGPVNDFETLYQLSEIARIPAIMPFGKHKGDDIAQLPATYKRWLLDQPDVDPYLRKALLK